MIKKNIIYQDLIKIKQRPEFLSVAFLFFSGLLFLTRISYINIIVRDWHFLLLICFYLFYKYRLSIDFILLLALVFLFFCPFFIFLKLAFLTSGFYLAALILFLIVIIYLSL